MRQICAHDGFALSAELCGREPDKLRFCQLALKFSDGFTQLWPSAIGLIGALVSIVMLTMALKSLPVGTAYAVWVGIGTLGVAVTGMIALGEAHRLSG